MGLSSLRAAFNYKVLSLRKGESGTIGRVNGLLVISHYWVNALPAIIWVCSPNKQYGQISGNTFDEMSFNLSWDGSGKNTQMKITSTFNGTTAATDFVISYQEIL